MATDKITRQGYTVRLDPELVTELKHIAVDEKTTMGELIEQAIRLFLEKRAKEKTLKK